MRFIQNFKIFESIENSINDINDLIAELVDDGYNIKIHKAEKNINIVIKGIKNQTINFSKIKDTLITIDSYVKEELNLKIFYHVNGVRKISYRKVNTKVENIKDAFEYLNDMESIYFITIFINN